MQVGAQAVQEAQEALEVPVAQAGPAATAPPAPLAHHQTQAAVPQALLAPLLLQVHRDLLAALAAARLLPLLPLAAAAAAEALAALAAARLLLLLLLLPLVAAAAAAALAALTTPETMAMASARIHGSPALHHPLHHHPAPVAQDQDLPHLVARPMATTTLASLLAPHLPRPTHLAQEAVAVLVAAQAVAQEAAREVVAAPDPHHHHPPIGTTMEAALMILGMALIALAEPTRPKRLQMQTLLTTPSC